MVGHEPVLFRAGLGAGLTTGNGLALLPAAKDLGGSSGVKLHALNPVPIADGLIDAIRARGQQSDPLGQGESLVMRLGHTQGLRQESAAPRGATTTDTWQHPLAAASETMSYPDRNRFDGFRA